MSTSGQIWILVPTQLFTDVTNKIFVFPALPPPPPVYKGQLILWNTFHSLLQPIIHSFIQQTHGRAAEFSTVLSNEEARWWDISTEPFSSVNRANKASQSSAETENTFSLSSSPSSCKMKTSTFYLIWDYLQIFFQISKLSIFIWPE